MMQQPNNTQGSKRRLYSAVLTAAMALGAFSGSGCVDPLKGQQIAELGDEVPGFEEMELHRPGQPCLVCHSDGGPGEPKFSFGGTLFFRPPNGDPAFLVEGYTVEILDSKGDTVQATSNACGNFYIELDTFKPAYPVRTEVLGTNAEGKLITNEVMTSRIARDGSCASCHLLPANFDSPGEVYVGPIEGVEDPLPPAEGACPPPYGRVSVQ